LSNQARAYSIRSSGYAIGAIIGPFAGGALARPAERWPTVFSAVRKCIVFAWFTIGLSHSLSSCHCQTGIFGIYPYLLPCVVAGAINLLGLVLGYFYLQETVNLPQDEATDGTSDDAEKQSQVINKNKHNLGFNSESFIEGLKKTTSLFMKAMKDHEVLVTMVLYAILAFVWLSFDEVFAIWALRPPEEGGVNFDEAQIGMAHAVSGVAMLFLQVFIYPPIDKKVGTLQVFNIAVSASCKRSSPERT
jgi:MFS family permease